ncbi:MAG TPA: ABC transporter permease [Rubrobacteraceae bacterium]|nr:ABC transporter permease [Rubrobacteraceae bacterium]
MQSSSEAPSRKVPTAAESLPGKSRSRRKGWARLPVTVRYVLLLAVFVGAWQLYVTLAHVSPLALPGPLDVARAFWDGWASGRLADATLTTLRVLELGMLVGVILASVFTVFATWTTVGADILSLLTAMFNPVPAIAMLPILILWFGINSTALAVVIVYSIVWPIAINLSAGFKTVNPTIMMVGRNLGLRGWSMVRDVLLPAALPHTITGLRTGWAFGWRTIVAAELVFGVAGKGGGLGFFINDARYFLRILEVFAGILTIALIGILVEAVFNRVERRTVVRWGMKSAA